MTDIDLEVGIDAKAARKGLNQFEKNVESSLGSIQSSFTSLRNIAAAAVGVFAGRAIISGIRSVTEAAAIQQDAINNLNTALKLSGEFSEGASKGFQDFASQIQSTTKFGDEAILQQVALAKAFGASNEQAKLITTAATELAAATGKSLDEATRQVSKTLGGFAGELGEVNPAIKALTQEQLRNGEAAKILIEQYGGSAAAQVNTFSGSTAQLSNVYGDLFEKIGDIITSNPVVISSVKVLTEAFSEVGKVIGENDRFFKELIASFLQSATSVVPALTDSLKFLIINFEGIVDLLLRSSRLIFSSLVALKIGPAVYASIVSSVKLFSLENLKATFSLKGLKSGFDILRVTGVTTFKALRISANILKASLTLGLTFVIDEAIGLLFKLKEEFGGLINVVKVGFLQVRKFFGDKTAQNQIEEIRKSARDAESSFEDLLKKSEDLNKSQKDNKDSAKDLADEIKKIIPNVDSLLDENKKLELQFLKIGKTQSEQAKIQAEFDKKQIDDQLKKIDLTKEEGKEAAALLEERKDLIDAQIKAGEEEEKREKRRKELAEQRRKEEEQRRKEDEVAIIKSGQISSVTKGLGAGAGAVLGGLAKVVNPIGAFTKGVQSAVGALQGVIDFIPQLLGSVSKLFTSLTELPIKILDGLVGLFDSVVGFASKFLENIVRSLGKIIVSAFKFILKDLPIAITNALKELPAIITEVFSALPNIIIDLANNLGPIIKQLVVGLALAIPDVAFALVDSLILKGGIFRIAFALAKALSIDLPIALAEGFLQAIKNAGGTIFSGLGEDFGKNIKIPRPAFLDDLANILDEPPFLQKLRDIFDSFDPGNIGGDGFGGIAKGLENIPIVGPAIGAVSNAISSVGSAISSPFALGGTVPEGFPNDSFPARLSSGEEVISMERAQKLDRFLEGGSQPVNISLKVGEQELANILYNINQRGFRTA
jgi:hypothetical protein